MATLLEIVPETGTDIVATVAANPGIVLVDTEKFDAWYEKLKAEAASVPVDLSTDKGRKAIASIAAKVRSEKAAIDKDRLRLTKEWRDLTAQVNGAWNGIEKRLNELAVEVRAPLTEWEAAEKARVDECRAAIEEMRLAKIIAEDDTAATVRERGGKVFNTVIDPDRFGDMLPEAESVKADAVDTLKRALARLLQEEADRAELAQLRAEREEAERLAAEKAAAEEAERQRVEAERIAEEQRVAAERAEAERIQRERDAAAQAAREEEARKAAEEQAARDAAHAAELQAERDRAAAAERERQAEIDRAAEAERQREAAAAAKRAEADRIAAEEAARAKNRAHRSQCMAEAKLAIMAAGSIDEAAAVAIVKAIVNGSVPRVALGF